MKHDTGSASQNNMIMYIVKNIQTHDIKNNETNHMKKNKPEKY